MICNQSRNRCFFGHTVCSAILPDRQDKIPYAMDNYRRWNNFIAFDRFFLSKHEYVR